MSETLQPSFISRLRYTPMRDLVRLRVTGRLDLKRLVESSNLPQPAQHLIMRVVRSTRLWPLEKVDVATELIAHFLDAQEAGISAEEAAKAFGDANTAAKLIRRAKIRNRPLIWHIRRAIQWALAAIVLLYLGKLLLIYTGRPSPSIDYIAEANKTIVTVPADQRAWTVYRQALLSLDRPPKEQTEARTEWYKKFDAHPGSLHWAELNQWLDAHSKTLNLIREGTSRPALGFVLGPDGSAHDPALYEPWTGAHDPALLTLIWLPHFNDMRLLANLLAADAMVARERNDSRRFVADISSIVKIAPQCREGMHFLICELVSIGVMSVALDQLDQSLAQGKPDLSDQQLQELAHQLGWPQRTEQVLSLDDERKFFYDLVQRSYTDNGHGDGHLTAAGIDALQDSFGSLPMPAAPLMASRRETVQKYDYFMDIASANLHRPLRETDWQKFDGEVLQLVRSPLERVRFFPVQYMLASVGRAQASAERMIAQRDSILVALALEAYRRGHSGTYPASLDQLVPALLPAVPKDPCDGKPFRYRLINGRPIIYSVGMDGDDDGGKPLVNKKGELENSRAAINPAHSDSPDADWILYPEPRNPNSEDMPEQ